MNKVLILAPLVLLSCKESCRVEDDEGEDAVILSFAETAEVAPTLEQDRLTYDKAMLAFDEEGGDQVEDTFELLSLDEAESGVVNPDQLTYQRALEAVYETDPAIAKQAAVLEAKRKALVGMIGSDVRGVTQGEYNAAKAEYEQARDLLRKLKAESATLYRRE